MGSPTEDKEGYLSRYLENRLKEVDEAGSKEEEAERIASGKIIRLMMESLEGFAEPRVIELLKVFRQDFPDIWRSTADAFYSREAVASIPKDVTRFLRLSPVLVGVIPSKEVSVYLREASRCFISGFHQATIALSRAALEAGLNDHFERKLGASPQMDLVGKIRGALKFKLINPRAERLADKIRKTGNRVLHQESASENVAFDILRDTRAFLMELYEQ